MASLLNRAWKYVSRHRVYSGLLTGIILLLLNRLGSLLFPDKEFRGFLGSAAKFLADQWSIIAFFLFLLLFIFLRRRIESHLQAPVKVMVGIHPLEVRLLQQLQGAKKEWLEIGEIHELLGADRRDGNPGLGIAVHLSNLAALKLIGVKTRTMTREVPKPPSPPPQFQAIALPPGLEALLKPTTSETITLYSLTDKGRTALKNLESLPEGFAD